MIAILNSIIKNPKGWSYDGKDDDEAVYYVFRKSLITNIGWILLTLLFIVLPSFVEPILLKETNLSLKFLFIATFFWYVFTFGFFLQSFFNWFFNVYIVTDKKIVDVDFHGLIYGNISEAKLADVEDVTSKISGTFRTIFEIGDVFVQTASESPQFEFHDVPRPAKIRDIVSDLVEKVKKDFND